MIEWLNQAWVGSVIGVVGVLLGALGLLAYRVSRVGRRPVFQTNARRLIGKTEQELPQGVQVLYNDKAVQRLTLTRVVFWNSGTATIPGEDIVAADPLRLMFDPGDTVLKAHLLKTTRQVINFQARQDTDTPHHVVVTFDYLDPQDGAVVEILHTSERRHPDVCGSIRGVPKGVRNWGDVSGNLFLPTPSSASASVRRRVRRMTNLFMVASGLLVGLVFLVISIVPTNLWRAFGAENAASDMPRVPLAFIGLFYLAPSFVMLWLRRRRYPASLVVHEA